ncbi:MAG: rod shape-determining protein MreC [Gemmatimonadaceae bacterium]|nr:rod shape-determining protein MreC [Gemmatimonadaceae bacterium]
MARASRFSSKVDLTIFVVCLFTALIISVIPGAAREPIAKGLRRSAMAPLVELQRSAERWRAAWVAAERETATRDTLAVQAFNAAALEAENGQLRRLLGLGSRLRWGFVPAEAIHSAGRAEPYTLTLTAGSNAGVTVGSMVVAPEGVVGKVVTVDPTMSLAITFSHVDFRTSAMTADESAFGIVSPHLGDAGPDSVRYLLELRGVPYRSEIRPGTVVYAAGIGGVFSRGVPVGTILREIQTPEGSWSRTYLVRPAVNPGLVSSVMIINQQRANEGMEGVWQMTTALDSAVRGVALAGDSLRRADSTAAAAAARQAVLDSAARLAPQIPDSLRRTGADTVAPPAAAGTPPAGPARPAPTQQAPRPVPPQPAPSTPRETTPVPVTPAPVDTTSPR